jgi:hypothetical protein
VDLSVIIPTYRRPAKLAACVAALARQTLPAERFELLVGLDGPDAQSEAAALAAWREAGGGDSLHVITCERRGYNAVRNRLLLQARGRYMVSLNDDVVPEPQFLATHLREQQAAEGLERPAIITGYSPFRRWGGEMLFDRLVRETSMVFFYDQMIEGDRHGEPQSSQPVPRRAADHDWGFRHCWGMNFSAPMHMVREVGMFTAVPLAYGYDDIELAWRLQQRFGTPVLFRPEARAEHDHRYVPAEVLMREHKLGEAAWHFAAISPVFAAAVFGRDIRSQEELEYSRAFVQRQESPARRLEASFLALGDRPAAALDGPHACQTLNLAYQQHLPLKRCMWRRGLLAAAAAEVRRPAMAAAPRSLQGCSRPAGMCQVRRRGLPFRRDEDCDTLAAEVR